MLLKGTVMDKTGNLIGANVRMYMDGDDMHLVIDTKSHLGYYTEAPSGTKNMGIATLGGGITLEHGRLGLNLYRATDDKEIAEKKLRLKARPSK